eukprot:CAMPEP_0204493416 /NCGR_PEP_ID=MMETSP0471-20130131/82033_1 /ASSEMBLY_ACC=CAM_ASM_000602 /TAXON_ID=2969 /ORGANISM="Oxyrrhis marina" /LENGTH=54 /DNA_ID=CAMNT_0051497547 /DNA_START=10 /DNA_END=171 /DNA_ORIENTATION=-
MSFLAPKAASNWCSGMASESAWMACISDLDRIIVSVVGPTRAAPLQAVKIRPWI